MTIITTENLNRAAINVWDNDIRPDYMFSEFRDNIEEMFTDSLLDTLENFDVEGSLEDNEGDVEEVAEEFLRHLSGEFDYRAAYDPTHEWVDNRLIYTADIMDFYQNNEAECDDALGEFDTSDCGSITEIIRMTAYCVMIGQAQSEMEEVRDGLERGNHNESFAAYLNDEVAGN